jgi:hypothetical protein
VQYGKTQAGNGFRYIPEHGKHRRQYKNGYKFNYSMCQSRYPSAEQILEENDLFAIVFDLSNQTLKLDLNVLRLQKGLLLIGVDTSNDEMLILSSHQKQSLSIANLIDVIQQKTTKPNSK